MKGRLAIFLFVLLISGAAILSNPSTACATGCDLTLSTTPTEDAPDVAAVRGVCGKMEQVSNNDFATSSFPFCIGHPFNC